MERWNTVMLVNSLSLLELRGVLEVPVYLLDPVALTNTMKTVALEASVNELKSECLKEVKLVAVSFTLSITAVSQTETVNCSCRLPP